MKDRTFVSGVHLHIFIKSFSSEGHTGDGKTDKDPASTVISSVSAESPEVAGSRKTEPEAAQQQMETATSSGTAVEKNDSHQKQEEISKMLNTYSRLPLTRLCF